MSLAGSDLEERILVLERQYWDLDWIRRSVDLRLVTAEQSLAALWMIAPPAAAAPVATAVSGSVRGCNTSNVGSGLTVVLKDSGGTTLLTTTTNTSGNYSGSITIAAATSVAATVTPTSSREAVITGSFEPVTPGTPHSFRTVNLAGSTNFDCSGLCGIPLSTSITLTASATACGGLTYPSDTLTRQSAPPSWASSLVSGKGWLGTALWTSPTDAANPNSYVYWLEDAGVLVGLRQNPSPQLISMANPPAIYTCPGSSFSLHYVCGTGINKIDATLSG